jgi:Winged helix DNA-binding domain
MGATALGWGCEGRNGCPVPVGWHGDACMQPCMRWASAQPGLPAGRKYNQPMPALPKVTPVQRQEIRRRRAAGETLLSIGRLVGLPHQTVSRIDRQERALQAEREAEAAAEQEAERALLRLWAGWTVSFNPDARGPLYGEGTLSQRIAGYAKEQAPLRRHVLRELERRGPLLSREIEDHVSMTREAHRWWGARKMGLMLDVLNAIGDVAVVGRRGGQRVWDLAERWYSGSQTLPWRQAERLLAEQRHRALGVRLENVEKDRLRGRLRRSLTLGCSNVCECFFS